MKEKSDKRSVSSDSQSTPESFLRMSDAIVGTNRVSDSSTPVIYPESIMKKVRQSLTFEPTDKSHDEEIMAMSKEDVFKLVCQWEGIMGAYPVSILRWVQSIFEVDLDI